jgi:DNA-binding GntR family transcriptional regulator
LSVAAPVRRLSPASPTRHESVVEELRDAIVTGAIAPGERLLQVELAERFGVSRIPLREALRTLHAEGLVVIEPNRGAVCRPLEPKDVSDLYAVRLALEQLAAREAAARFVDLREPAARAGEAALAAVARGDLGALIRLDFEFHDKLARAAGNAHAAHLLDGCRSQIVRAMHYFFKHDAYPRDVWRQHADIARTVAHGDGEGAAALLERHIFDSRNAILRGLEEADR